MANAAMTDLGRLSGARIGSDVLHLNGMNPITTNVNVNTIPPRRLKK